MARPRVKAPLRRRSKIWLQPGPGQISFDFATLPEVERPSPEAVVQEQEGIQGPYGPSPEPDWDYYWPTKTINPLRPRTHSARYSARFSTLEVIFRDGTPWHYDQVPEAVWYAFKRVESPGRFINSILNNYPYGHGGWGSIVGE